ncbi:MAG TPA: protein tyrosine phosphatase [Isosphaeraceae bacterium]|jgi:hypothetical protein|nr:protein tyrosine phosphatase [Isosphaeraceae bacterium]
MTESGPGSWRNRVGAWPWLVLALAVVPAIWHVLDFEEEPDAEFPAVARPTFNRRPPAAYRLAEPGDTIDRVGLYAAAAGVVLAAAGAWQARGRGLWPAVLGLEIAACWYAATPGPLPDGWHGLGWRVLVDPAAPAGLRLALAAAAGVLGVLVVGNLLASRHSWRTQVAEARRRGAIGLLGAALALVVARQFELPGVEPAGYWPRFAMAWGLLAFDLALIRLWPAVALRWSVRGLGLAAGGLAWLVLVAGGIALVRFQRPIHRLKEAVPGRIFIGAMPTARGLALAHGRHHFKTIVNLFPEDLPGLRSPNLAAEERFVREHGIRYLRNPVGAAQADEFLDTTLALAQDPDAWPILIHCHGCMDRTPAWLGIYRFVVEGRPLDEVMREIERQRGYRPKASVTLLYNRVLPPRAPGRYAADPTAAVLRSCARGTVDPFFAEYRAATGRANPRSPARVGRREGGAAEARRP